MEITIYKAAGGQQAFLALAHAWHQRCLADPVVSHAFSHHPVDPQHTERLAAYWAESLGGPREFTESMGEHSEVLRMHSGNGPHTEMDERAQVCFAQALDDADLPTDERLRTALKGYFLWSTAVMSAYSQSATDVPDGLPMLQYSWDGPIVG